VGKAPRRAGALGSVLGAALIVAGCSGGAPTTPPGPTAQPLPPGTYTSIAFQPPVTFTLPAGWEKPSDTPSYLELRPVGSEVAGIHLFRDPQAAAQDTACTRAAEPGVGGTSTELVAWIRGRPGLVVSTPALVTVGELRGVQLDIGIAAGWTVSCPFADGIPTVPFVTSEGYHWVIAGGERLRVYVLDLPGGGTVMVDLDDFVGDLIDVLISDATPIVRSLSFDAG
jgi:hypothetical protein